MFRLWWMSNNALKERADYLEKIALLKWDIWFYYTGIQLVVTFALLGLILLAFIAYAFTSQTTFVDPFSSSKIAFFVLNSIFIITLVILNCNFIFEGAKNENRKKRMATLLGISVLTLLFSIIMFCTMNGSMHENINLLHESNPEMYKETILSTLIPNTSDLNYFIPFWILSVAFILIIGFIVYLDSIWLYRLDKKDTVMESTDILFDDEKNVKY